MEATNASDGTIHIEGVFINHGLHHHRMATANGDSAYWYRAGFAAMDSSVELGLDRGRQGSGYHGKV
ncbi:hypothetical protein BEST7613_2536 [Synechocystis sp. PCC 6803]|nr:hypothetical protein BEST7613_2536 [Synechocystis sp. PCC 6803] [Bacillus subtilis BEST7613]